MKHLIFTNFGVGIFDVEWLVHRLEVFKVTTLASLSSQTCRDFTWYVFVHENIPAPIFIQLQDALAGSKLDVHLVSVSSYDNISNEISRIKGSCSCHLLITSRIDDDDLICTEGVEKVQHVSGESCADAAVVSFVNGAEYLPIEGIAVNRKLESIAIMLSMASRRGDDGSFLSVNEFAHHSIVESLRSRGIDSTYVGIETQEPSYLYVKHPLSDSFYSGARARVVRDSASYKVDARLFERFGVDSRQVERLVSVLAKSPNGMPYKYLDKLNSLRRTLRDPANSELHDRARFTFDRMSRKATRCRPWAGKNRKIRIAILGSCVTRDLFEFCQELKADFEICFYTARSSVVSYMSPPCIDSSIKIGGSRFEDLRAFYDVSKCHWNILRESRPDIIVLDFIDERIGLVQHQGSWVTASGPIVKAFNEAGIDVEVNRPWSEEVVKLREWALREFLGKALDISENVILHKASWSEKMKTDAGDIVPVDERWNVMLRLNNEILEGMFSVVDEDYPMIDVIGGREVNMISGGDHRWEYSPFHYDRSYYDALAGQLKFRVF